MATVGQLIYEVGADTTKAHSNVAALHTEFSRAPGILGLATGALGGFVAGGALLGIVSTGFNIVRDAIGDVVGKAGDAETVMAQTNAVLKSTHGQAGMTAQAVSALADQYMSLTGVDDEVVQSTENMLLTFGNISSKVFPQTTMAALDMSAAFKAMGKETSPVDIAIMLGKALNDPLHGMTALQRVGVTFDADQQKAIATAMRHHDVMAAQKVILQELSKEFGGSAAAAGETYAGKMAILQGKLDNVKEAIGARFLPILSSMIDRFMPLIDIAGNVLPPLLDRLIGLFSGSFASSLQTTASQVASQVLPVLTQLGQFAQTVLIPAVMNLAQMFMTQLYPILAQIQVTLLTALLPALMQLGGLILTQLAPAVLKLVAAIAPVLMPVLQALGFIIGNVVVPVVSILITVLATVIGWITQLIGWIGNAVGVVSGWGAGWTAFVATISGVVIGGFNTIRGVINGAVSFVTGLFVSLYNHNIYFHMLVDIIISTFNRARAAAVAIWNSVLSTLSGAWNSMVNLGRNAFNTLVSIISSTVGRAAQAAGAIANAILGPIRDINGRLFEAGKAMIQMLINGIKSMAGAVGKAAGDIAGQVGKFLGFHSPTEEGPGATADLWMPNLGKMLASGLHGQRSSVGAAALALAGDVASALSGGSATAGLTVAGSRSSAGSSAAAGPTGGGGSSGGRPIYLVLDDAGKRVIAKGIIEDVVAELQRAGVKTGT
jgi:phage-related protein